MRILVLLTSLTIFFQTFIYCQDNIDSADVDLENILEKGVQKSQYVQSASKYMQTVYEAPYSLDLVSGKSIKTFGYSKLSEVLNSLGGLYLSSDLNYEYVGFSGFGIPTDYNSRIQILIDGHVLADHVYNSSLIDELSLNIKDIEQIEVVKGPGSVLYGGNAMFGVINIIPKREGNSLLPKITASFGSFNTKKISASLGYGETDDLNFKLLCNYSSTSGRDFYFKEFEAPDFNGQVKGLDGEKQYGLYSSLKYSGFELSGLMSFRRKDVPAAQYETDFGSNSPTKDIISFIEVKYNHNLTYDKLITAKIFHDSYFFQGNYIYGGKPAWDKDHSKSFGTELQYIWDVLPSNRLTAGAGFTKIYRADYKYWDEENTYSQFDFNFNKYNLFLQDEHQFNEFFNLYVALRYDSHENIGDEFSPRVTLIYSPDLKNTLRLLWGTSFRMPSLYEKYYEDLESGYKQNPSLQSEKISTIELNWNYRLSGSLFFNASIFHNKVTDFINLGISPEDSLYNFTNNGSLKLYGFKIEAEFNYEDEYGGYCRYAWQNVRDSTNKTIVNSPGNLLKAGVYYVFANLLNVAFEYRYETSRLTYYETNTSNVHYAALNLNNSRPLYGFDLSFRVNNLFNKTIENPGGLEHLQPVFTMPGRNFMFSISYELL